MKKLTLRFGVPGVFAPDDGVLVHSARLHEALNEVPRAELELLVQPALAPDALSLPRWPGAQGVLHWAEGAPGSGAARVFAGVVDEARTLLDGEGRVTRIALHLHAWPAAAGGRSHARRHQFYEGRSSLEMAESVFCAAGGVFERAPAVRSDARAYEVQYAESDADFALRVLGEDGLACIIAPDWSGAAFPPQPVALRMRVCDALRDLPAPADADGLLPHRPVQALALDARHGIEMLTQARRRGPGEVALAAVLPQQPNVDLRVSASQADDAHCWVDVATLGPARTRQQLDRAAEAAVAAPRAVAQHFATALPWVRAGLRAQLQAAGTTQNVALVAAQLDFGRDTLGEWLLSTQATALDLHAAWRPVPPPRPVLPSLLYGTVLDAAAQPAPARQHAEPDSQVHTDGQGRVRVRIAWHTQARREENADSSIWLRVMTPWAGHGAGFFALPRAGQEVLVGFIQGDAAQPVVLGALYAEVAEGGATPPWPTAGGEHWVGVGTRTDTGHAQHLRLSGDPARPQVELHAARDLAVDTGRDIGMKAGRHIDGRAADSVSLQAARDVDLRAGADGSFQAATELRVEAPTVKVLSTTKNDTTTGVSYKTSNTNYASYIHAFDATAFKQSVIGDEIKLAALTHQARGANTDLNGRKMEVTIVKDVKELQESKFVATLVESVATLLHEAGLINETSGAKLKTAATDVKTGGPSTDSSAIHTIL